MVKRMGFVTADRLGTKDDGEFVYYTEYAELASKLDTARQLLMKIGNAMNDPLLSQRVRISVANDIRTYLEPPK